MNYFFFFLFLSSPLFLFCWYWGVIPVWDLQVRGSRLDVQATSYRQTACFGISGIAWQAVSTLGVQDSKKSWRKYRKKSMSKERDIDSNVQFDTFYISCQLSVHCICHFIASCEPLWHFGRPAVAAPLLHCWRTHCQSRQWEERKIRKKLKKNTQLCRQHIIIWTPIVDFLRHFKLARRLKEDLSLSHIASRTPKERQNQTSTISKNRKLTEMAWDDVFIPPFSLHTILCSKSTKANRLKSKTPEPVFFVGQKQIGSPLSRDSISNLSVDRELILTLRSKLCLFAEYKLNPECHDLSSNVTQIWRNLQVMPCESHSG